MMTSLPSSSISSSLASSKVRFADDENLSTVLCEIPNRDDLEDHMSDLFFSKSDFSETRQSAKIDSRECTVQHFLEGSFTVKSKQVQDQLNEWTREGPRGLERWSCKQHADERNSQQFEAIMAILQAQQDMLNDGDARFDYFAGKKRIGEIIQDDLIRKVALKVTRSSRHFARMMGKADSTAAAIEFNNDQEVQQLAAEWDKFEALKRNSTPDDEVNSVAGNSMAESVNSSASSIMLGQPSLESMGYGMLGSDLLLGSSEDVGLLDDEEEEDFGFLPQVDEVQKQDNEGKRNKKSESSKRLSLLKKMKRRLSAATTSSGKASRRSSTGTSSSRRSSATGSSKSSSKNRRASVTGSSSRRSSATGSTRRSSMSGSSDAGSSRHRRSIQV